MFGNYTMTASGSDVGRPISFDRDWLGVTVSASAVASGASAVFRVQWSNDNVTWFDPAPQDTVGTLSAAGSVVAKFTIKALYWRLVTTLTGASVTCSASAIV
jgi:hypothetical protein